MALIKCNIGCIKSIVVIILCMFIFFVVSSTCSENSSSGRTASESKSNLRTQAREFAPKVKVTLDVTTPEELLRQIPFRAELSRGRGEDRIYKWRFEDGSAMVAYFRPASGHQNGLRLHRVDFE